MSASEDLAVVVAGAATKKQQSVARTISMCHGTCKNGRPCMKAGTIEKFGGCFCKTHVAQAAFQRDCPICLNSMTTDDSVALTCCGNAFHVDCLAKQTAIGGHFQCAMCRDRIDGEVLSTVVHKAYVQEMGRQIFSIRDANLIPVLCQTIQVTINQHNNV